MGLQCQTPLKDLKFTDTVATWPLSYKLSLCENKTGVSSFQLGKALSIVSSGSLKVPKVLGLKKILGQQKF